MVCGNARCVGGKGGAELKAVVEDGWVMVVGEKGGGRVRDER